MAEEMNKDQMIAEICRNAIDNVTQRTGTRPTAAQIESSQMYLEILEIIASHIAAANGCRDVTREHVEMAVAMYKDYLQTK